MLSLAIHTLEMTLFALVGMLAYRIYKLSADPSAEQATASAKSPIAALISQIMNEEPDESIFVYSSKMDNIKKAQVFAGTQLIEVKREFADLNHENLAWLREAISLYLIGGIDFIGKQSNSSTKSRRELINLVLKTNLSISEESADNYFNEALHRQPRTDSDYMVRAGAKAAKLWLSQQTVPSNFSLRTQLQEWGVFA